ncbi:MAG: hypothetical protein ABII71_04630 [Candidatus Micrarchaeota archaeon]
MTFGNESGKAGKKTPTLEPGPGAYSSKPVVPARKLRQRLGQQDTAPAEEFNPRSTFRNTPAIVIESERPPREDTTEVDTKPSFPVETDEAGISVVDISSMIRHTESGAPRKLVIEGEDGRDDITLVGGPVDPQNAMASRYFPDFSEGNGSLAALKSQLQSCYFGEDGELRFKRSSTSKERFIRRLERYSDFPILIPLIRKVASDDIKRLKEKLQKCEGPLAIGETKEKISRMQKILDACGDGCEPPKLQFRLLKTENHMFILSPFPLDFVQDAYPSLTAKGGLDNQALFYWPKKTVTGQTSGYMPAYLVIVDVATVEALGMADSESSSISAVLLECNGEIPEKSDSFAPPAKKAIVDLEEFKAKLVECTEDKKSDSYFDPKAFAEDIASVLAFTDEEGRRHYEITVVSVGFKRNEYTCRLYVNPESRDDFPSNSETFYFGKELCVLVYS